jgi:hypothetical protein
LDYEEERYQRILISKRGYQKKHNANDPRIKKKEKTMKKAIFVIFICLMATSAYAESKGFQASLVPDVAIHSKDTHIKGFSLNIWGENPQSAFALGFVNGSTGDSAGFTWAVLVNYAENYTGLAVAPVNYASGSIKGVQSGFINYAGKLTGLQLGAVNVAKTAQSGIQVGLVNVIQDNQWFTGFPQELAKGMIFVNWRF